ncbi:hypothetical protein ACJIZ3_017254 [Penstemon smallii]|uniref:Uncharacterized protein n=1 Tax=Penstemon smallii TaxID=265156 RepID=A0ABD3SV11_9LAMI
MDELIDAMEEVAIGAMESVEEAVEEAVGEAIETVKEEMEAPPAQSMSKKKKVKRKEKINVNKKNPSLLMINCFCVTFQCWKEEFFEYLEDNCPNLFSECLCFPQT